MKVKFILILLSILFVIAQFIPVDQSNPAGEAEQDFFKLHPAPEHVETLIKNACYDCHSYETVWPWYSSISPVSNWVAHHVEEGREHLNFSTFGEYSSKKAAHKLEECFEEIEEGEMPLASHTWVHEESRLSDEEKEELIQFFKRTYLSY